MKKIISILLLGVLLTSFQMHSIPSYTEVQKENLYDKNTDAAATQNGFLYNGQLGYVPDGVSWHGSSYRFLTAHSGDSGSLNVHKYKQSGPFNDTENHVTDGSLGWTVKNADGLGNFKDNMYWWDNGTQSKTYETQNPYGFMYLTNTSGSDATNRNLTFYLYVGFHCYLNNNRDSFLNATNDIFTVKLDTGVTYNHYQNLAFDDTDPNNILYYVNVAASDSLIDDNNVPVIFGSQYSYLGTAHNSSQNKQKYIYGEKTTESDYNNGRYNLEGNSI